MTHDGKIRYWVQHDKTGRMVACLKQNSRPRRGEHWKRVYL